MALTEKTTTTVGFLVLTASALVSGGLWLNGKFDDAGKKIENVRGDLQTLGFKVERIDDKVTNYVNRSEFEAWALKLSRDNGPTLKVPEFK